MSYKNRRGGGSGKQQPSESASFTGCPTQTGVITKINYGSNVNVQIRRITLAGCLSNVLLDLFSVCQQI